jgi:YHS domain-containing protein
MLLFGGLTAMAQHDAHAGHKHANAADGKFLGKGDGITTCPVTGEAVTKNISGEFFGRTVYFCCPGCLEKAKQSPGLYVKPTAVAAQSSQKSEEKKFLGKGDGLETCPVTGEPVNKQFKGEVDGRVFYVCCPGCLDQVKKDPDLYLRPEKKEDGHAGHDNATSATGKFLGKGDGITTCPVTGEPINKEVSAVIDGRTIYACCAGCLDAVKKNPELYLKKN